MNFLNSFPVQIACLWFAAALFSTGFAASASAEDRQLIDPPFLDSLRAEVRANHPTIAAAEARAKAAEIGIDAVRLWDDPMVGAGFMAADREMRADDGDILLMAEQALPRRSLYRARSAKARAEQAVFEAEKGAAALSLETLVAQSVIELGLTDEKLLIEASQLHWLESMSTNARERLKDPMGNASEPLRIESETAEQRQKIDSTKRARQHLAHRLNILLARSPDAKWPVLELPRIVALPATPSEAENLAELNPSLQALQGSARAADAEVESAQSEAGPIFSLALESTAYSDGEFRQATFIGKMTLPIFSRSIYQANVARARQEQSAAKSDIESLGRKLNGELIAAQTDAEIAAREALNYSREVIPLREKASESTENAWISSKASLLEVLEARRALLNSRLEERRLAAAYQAALETVRSITPPQRD